MTTVPDTGFTDGEWHRLHPLTPLLRGGIAFVAILGIIIVNLRDIVIEIIFGGYDGEGEPLVWLLESGYLWLGVGAVILGLVAFVVGFWLWWRMQTFRITNEVVEVRSGMLFRTNRRGRLDRIQGVNIVRPFLARLVGVAKLEVNVAGQDANIKLEYLGSAAADELRRDVLRLASGTQAAAVEYAVLAEGAPPTGLVEQRISEMLAPELTPDLAPPASVVTLNLGRLIGSIVLSGFTIFLIGVIVALVIAATRSPFFLVGFVPAIIGMGGYYISKFTRSLRYSIAGTPDGVRVGFGLLSTTNETLPPGRIHSVQVRQPLLWRLFGWWEIKVNRAGKSSSQGAAGQANTTILPVGNLSDVHKVLALLLPELTDEESTALLERGMVSKGGDATIDPGFTNSPRRARILRWFSVRRNGFALLPSAVLLRKGAIWRELVVVPLARVQSVALHEGPLYRVLRVASLHFHTVAGPIVPTLGAIDRADAVRFFREAVDAAVLSSTSDTSHRWRSAERS